MAAAQRLDLSLRPSDTIRRVRAHRWRWTSDFQYLFMISVALISLHIAPIHFRSFRSCVHLFLSRS